MRIKVNFLGVLIGVKSNVGKNGNTYYNLSLSCDDEAGTVSCNKDVFDAIQTGQFKKFKDYGFVATYNVQYGSLQVVQIYDLAEK